MRRLLSYALGIAVILLVAAVTNADARGLTLNEARAAAETRTNVAEYITRCERRSARRFRCQLYISYAAELIDEDTNEVVEIWGIDTPVYVTRRGKRLYTFMPLFEDHYRPVTRQRVDRRFVKAVTR